MLGSDLETRRRGIKKKEGTIDLQFGVGRFAGTDLSAARSVKFVRTTALAARRARPT